MKKILTILLLFSLTGSSQYLIPYRDVTPGVSCPTDADAAAFLTAAGISEATICSGIDRLVKDFKGEANGSYTTYNIWSKIKAYYPAAGGTSTTNAVNLKTPGTYDLTFSGGWTHASTGSTPNGTTGYASTGINPNTDLTQYSYAIGFYSRTNINDAVYDMGCQDFPGYFNIISFIIIDGAGDLNTAYYGGNANNAEYVYPVGNTDSRGFYMTNRTANNVLKGFKNGAQAGSTTTVTSSAPNPNLNLYVGALNYAAGSTQYGMRECAGAIVCDGLTDAEATFVYNAIQAFNTTLGRQM